MTSRPTGRLTAEARAERHRHVRIGALWWFHRPGRGTPRERIVERIDVDERGERTIVWTVNGRGRRRILASRVVGNPTRYEAVGVLPEAPPVLTLDERVQRLEIRVEELARAVRELARTVGSQLRIPGV